MLKYTFQRLLRLVSVGWKLKPEQRGCTRRRGGRGDEERRGIKRARDHRGTRTDIMRSLSPSDPLENLTKCTHPTITQILRRLPAITKFHRDACWRECQAISVWNAIVKS